MPLRADRDPMHELLDQLTVEAWVSERGTIVAANAQLTGRASALGRRDAPVGMPFWELFDGETAGEAKRWYEGWRASGRGHDYIQLADRSHPIPKVTAGLCSFRLGERELCVLVPPGGDARPEELRELGSLVEVFRSYLWRGKIGFMVYTVAEGLHVTMEYVSEEIAEILMRPVSELLGADPMDLLVERHRRAFQELSKHQTAFYMDQPFLEVDVLAGDGDTVTLEVMTGPVTWKGRPAQFALIRDITERTMMLEELTRYAEAFELIQDTVVLADGNFNVIYVNPAGLKRSGYSLDEVVDKPVQIFGAMRAGEQDAAVLANILVKEGTWRGERWAVNREGVEYPVDIVVTLQKDPTGKPQMVTLVSRDISEQKAHEMNLMRARERAEFFMDLMSHDINNYIQGVLGRLELLSGTSLDEAQRNHISQAMEQAKRTSELVARVRTLSQARHGRQLVPMDLGEVLWEAVEDLRRKYKDVPFNVQASPQHERVQVLADELLTDLVINILDNSIKHSRTHPVSIEVVTRQRWEDRRRFWRLEVADNGPGIPDSEKEEAFYRFLRRGGRPDGSGLGLSLVMAIAERYSGRAWIEDRVQGDHSKGARVVVELPAA